MTDNMQQMALDTLGAYFGYTSFRPGQDRMVDAILAGRDALGVMPTGAGKSICYQVPALMLPGITFVVSPLLSLMEDQTRALLAAGARPSYLNSSLTLAQQNTVLKRAREGRYQLMYVAPERLLEPRFLAFAQEVAAEGGIGVPLVAIDEAHCVSQWGQDFRPAYLQIREFIDSLPQRPIVAAFTATATERVRADIQQMLGLQNPATVVTGFDRKNLYFGCEEMGDKAKTAWVRDYVIAHSSESGIVYCSTRKTVDDIHTTASSHGRVFVIEIMGHKVGWIPLYAGVAGGADVILIPEIPYDMDNVIKTIEHRMETGSRFTIVAVAEGAISKEDAALSKREYKKKLAERTSPSIVYDIAKEIEAKTGRETRVALPGHTQRGGQPDAQDRIFATQCGVEAALGCLRGEFGYMIALRDGKMCHMPLEDVAGKLKYVDPQSDLVREAKALGISFGDE